MPYDPAVWLWGIYLPMRNESICLHKNLYINVYTRFEEIELRTQEGQGSWNLQGRELEMIKLHRESASNLQSSSEYWLAYICVWNSYQGWGKSHRKEQRNNHHNSQNWEYLYYQQQSGKTSWQTRHHKKDWEGYCQMNSRLKTVLYPCKKKTLQAGLKTVNLFSSYLTLSKIKAQN